MTRLENTANTSEQLSLSSTKHKVSTTRLNVQKETIKLL